MDEFTKRAIISAINTEKASHDLYFLAANRATDENVKKLLMKLACDEFEHMSGFISIYPEGESEFASLLFDNTDCSATGSQALHASINQLDTWDQALSIAIMEEKSCIEKYSILVDAIRIPEVHVMFKKALDETELHLKSIEAEYARCMGMNNE